MLTILLVDDEPLARRDVRARIPWKEWGYEVVAEAANGAEALDQCEAFAPDIALVDITMPVMDGLTLLERLRAAYPRTQVIILTAHSEFGYAQQAIQKGAVGYILKSQLHASLTKEALDRARQEIEKLNLAGEHRQFQDDVIQRYRYPLRKQFFEDLLSGGIADSDIVRKAASVGIQLPSADYILLIFAADESTSLSLHPMEEDHGQIQFRFLEAIRHQAAIYFPNRFEIFPNTFGRCSVLLRREPGDAPFAEALHEGARQLLDALNEALLRSEDKWTAIVLVSEPFPTIRQLRQQYRLMQACYGHRYYLKKPQPIMLGKVAELFPRLTPEYDRLYEQFQDVLAARDPKLLDKWLNQVLQASLNFKPEPDLLRKWLFALKKPFEAEAAGEPLTDWPPFALLPTLQASLEQLRQTLAFHWETQQKMVKTRPEIARTIDYIKHHLDEDLSLEYLSNIVELSPTYLGRLFKRDIGMSMIDYIMEQRIQLAKKHLMDGTYRNYELAEKIGFKSYSYFCTIFKKVTGQTPNEYKNSQMIVNPEA